MSATDHAAAYFAATADLANQIPLDRVEAMARDLVAVRERWREALPPRRRRRRRTRVPRGQRLPQTGRDRELRAQRQRLRADRPDQRRRLGHGVLGLARNLAVERRGRAFVFSVGGGSREHNTSVNLVNAMELGKERGAKLFGVCGVPGGTLADLADVVVDRRAGGAEDAAGRVLPGGRLACADLPARARRPGRALGKARGGRAGVTRRAPSSSTATASSTSWSRIPNRGCRSRRCSSAMSACCPASPRR